MDRRTALGCVAGMATLAAPLVVAQIANINDAINKAGRLRMFSQRISKGYMALGLGVATQRAQEVIDESMAKFDRNLFELAAFAPKPHIKAAYAELQAVWAQYKGVLVGQAPNRAVVPGLIDLDGRLLKLADQGASQLEEVSGQTVGHLVNIAGRQRMLSQRAAKLFLAQAWKAPLPQASAELQVTRSEFSAALGTLANAPQATRAIKQEIELAREQWVFFEMGLAYQGTATPKAMENVFVSSENVLRIMDTVAEMYAGVLG